MKESKILKLAQIANETISQNIDMVGYKDIIISIQDYIANLKKAKKETEKAISLSKNEKAEHETYQHWTTLNNVISKALQEINNSLPSEILDYFSPINPEAARTLSHDLLATLKNLKNLFSEIQNQASWLERHLKEVGYNISFHLPYDIIDQSLDKIDQSLYNKSFMRAKKASTIKISQSEPNIEYDNLNQDQYNYHSEEIKNIELILEKLNNLVNLGNDIPGWGEFINQYISKHFINFINELIKTQSSVTQSSTIKQITSLSANTFQHIDLFKSENFEKIHLLINEIIDIINNIPFNSLGMNWTQSGNINNAIKNIKSIQSVINDTSNGNMPENDPEKQKIINDYEDFRNSIKDTINNIPAIKLQNGKQFYLNQIYEIVENIYERIITQSSSKTSHYKKNIIKISKEITIQDQKKLLGQFLYHITNMKTYLGDEDQQRLSTIIDGIQEAMNSIDSTDDQQQIDERMFQASIKLVKDFLNNKTQTIDDIYKRYSSILPNISTFYQSINNYINGMGVSYEEAINPRTGQNFSLMLTSLQSAYEDCSEDLSKLQRLKTIYQNASKQVTNLETKKQITSMINDVQSSLLKIVQSQKIKRFWNELIGKGIDERTVQNFLDNQVAPLQEEFKNLEADLIENSTITYNEVVKLLNGDNNHAISRLTYGLIPINDAAYRGMNFGGENIPQETSNTNDGYSASNEMNPTNAINFLLQLINNGIPQDATIIDTIKALRKTN